MVFEYTDLLERASSVTSDKLDDFISEMEHKWNIEHSPSTVVPWGLALWRAEHFTKARDVLDLCSEHDRNNEIYLMLRGLVLRKLPDSVSEAEACFRGAIALCPDRADAYYHLGNLLLDIDSFEEAEENYKRCLSIDHMGALPWHNLGISLNGQQRYEEALTVLKSSLKLDPFSADAWCNLGLAYFGANCFLSSKTAFEIAISLDDSHSPSFVNIGNALIGLLQPEQALTYLERGVQLEQSSSNSLWNLSLAYLLMGDFDRGWKYYEARFATKNFTDDICPTSGLQPQALADCSRDSSAPLIIWTEQGIGDAIQFGRYLSMMSTAGIAFKFMTRKSLISLFRDWFGLGDCVIEQPSSTCHEDKSQQIPLLSLPRLFGTRLHTVPSICPYIKPPGPVPAHLKVSPPPSGLSIGIVWATNPHNRAMYRNKSCPLSLLMPHLQKLMGLDLINVHSLQVGSDVEQLDPWRSCSQLTDWSPNVKDFSDTAYVINQLDLVISVDTAVAHLAGALNKPIWLLLPCNADFR